MRRLWTLAALLVVTAMPAAATGFSAFASGWDPKAMDKALGGGLGISIPFGQSPVGLDVRTTYYRDANLDNVGDDNRDVFGKLQIVPVDAAVRWEINHDENTPAHVYLGGGASYFFLSLRDSNLQVNDEVGWLGFLGVRFGSFFVEGAYRNARATVKNDNINDGLVHRARIDLDGAAVNAGYAWSF